MATQATLEQFVTQVTRPAQFDTFWDGVLQELTALPLDARLTPVPLRSTAEVLVSRVSYRSLGAIDITAWYCVPAHGTGPFPALLILPGYKGEPGLPRAWASKGVATLSVAVRGKLQSQAQYNPGYPGLLTSGIESPATYGYRGVIADCVRGVDFLLSRPEVEAQRLFACGSSQGGGLTLITAALRPEIRGGVAGYPFLCCFPEAMRLLRTYPYEELNCYARAYPERLPQMLETLRYYDAVNFVERITCPMVVGIALDDEVCPPETSYAAYQRLSDPKELWLFPDSGHNTAHAYPAREAAWLEHQMGLAAPREAA